MDEVRAQLKLPETATFGTLVDPERTAFLREVIARIQPHSTQWRKDAIAEIRESLATAVGIPNAS
jgi:hypothetical protein